jgi:hypothetical protein
VPSGDHVLTNVWPFWLGPIQRATAEPSAATTASLEILVSGLPSGPVWFRASSHSSQAT